jgi:subtilisin family serine protease
MACGYRKSPRLRATLLVVFLTLLTVGLGSQGALGFEAKMGGGWQPGPDEYHPSRLIVEFDTGIRIQAAADSVHKLGYSLESVQSFVPTEKFPGGLSVGIVDIPESETVDRAIARLNGAPGIIRAERDYKKYKCSEPVFPNDIYFPQMWPLHNHDLPENYRDPEMPWYYDPVNDADIDAPEAWAMFKGSSEVIVAVIDTGTYIDHPDLADHIWVNEAELYGEPGVDDDGNGYIDDIHGWDFYNNDNSVFDRDLNDEHGTTLTVKKS